MLDETDVDVVSEVMSDVLKGAEKCFNDEGIPKEVLEKLKALWIKNLDKVRANEPDAEPNPGGSGEAEADSSGATNNTDDDTFTSVNVASKSPNFVGFSGADMGISVEAAPNTGARPKFPIVNLERISSVSRVAQRTKKEESRRKKQHKKGKKLRLAPLSQVDGPHEDSSDEEENLDDDDDDDDDADEDDDDDLDKEDEDNEDGGAEEEPLGSDDDISDEDPADLFDTENVVVCQYDRITRARNKWKFHLKDGIMNLNGRDYVFQKANGDAEW